VDPDKAGRRHAQREHRPQRSREASDNLNHNVFASFPAPAKFAADPRRRRCRSSSLRALHLDPDLRSTAIRHKAGTVPNNTEKLNGSQPLQGSPTHITPCRKLIAAAAGAVTAGMLFSPTASAGPSVCEIDRSTSKCIVPHEPPPGQYYRSCDWQLFDSGEDGRPLM
jgi:hypothetical protein